MSSTLLHQAFLRTSLKPVVSRLGVQTTCFKSPVLRSLSSLDQQRFASSKTLKCSEEDALNLLNEQRKLRPNSPHFTIYEPQLTWYSSFANRVTGCALSVGFYAYALGYMAMPSSMPLDSDTIVQLVASSPEWAKVAGKAVVALPFTYHTFNGVRHLAWDMGYLLDLKTSYTAGYTVLGLTAVSTVGLALI
uniref:Succinate dehydrogenase complex subunit C n=1 Tax=Puccinia horiana TaxID=331382 RepID=A0A7I8BEQ3_9BASI|nr:succinate dehydrogenase complex subunit C [Puccinia horiana]BCF86794.1 succinate dehydrogenase complex subunit C [Puccinia horiana]BCF86795.1 succinate dehydrogenase complex subunit C [Puccinia horiana]BCF86796.1 succinate dehydrogenase complex subunit C [Puccinia horiana]